MSLLALRLGLSVGPFEDRFDVERVHRFSAATGRAHPRQPAGVGVPPGAAVTLLWEAQNAGRDALVPQEFQHAASGGVHGEHDIVWHRRFTLDEPLVTWVEGWGARPAGGHSVVTLHYVTKDADDHVVVEQWWSTVWLGVTCRAEGVAAPEHAFPDEARNNPVGSWTVDVDEDMARRYAEVSGDWSAHHFDEAAARRSGSDRPFLHGLCTLALCARRVRWTPAQERASAHSSGSPDVSPAPCRSGIAWSSSSSGPDRRKWPSRLAPANGRWCRTDEQRLS